VKNQYQKSRRPDLKKTPYPAGNLDSKKTEESSVKRRLPLISYVEASIFIISGLIFSGIIFFNCTPKDILFHAVYLVNIINENVLPPANFLYYLTIYAVSFFSEELLPLCISSVLVLSLAVTSKFVITQRFVLSYFQKDSTENGQGVPPDTVIRLISLILVFAFSIPLGYFMGRAYYLGHIPPTVWHNSTTIFLMPFALLLFWVSYQQLFQPTRPRMFLITVLIVLNILIKPNYFFVFCIAYPLMLIRFFGFRKQFWINISPVVIGAVLLAIEYYAIYRLGYSNLYAEKSSVVVRPFMVWLLFTHHIGVAFLSSVLFPLAVTVLYWRDIRDSSLLQYSGLSFLIAVVIFCLLAETGPRLTDGNFLWQCIVCNYILFLVAAVLFLEKIYAGGMSRWKMGLISSLYVLHFLSGVGYLMKVFATKEFF